MTVEDPAVEQRLDALFDAGQADVATPDELASLARGLDGLLGAELGAPVAAAAQTSLVNVPLLTGLATLAVGAAWWLGTPGLEAPIEESSAGHAVESRQQPPAAPIRPPAERALRREVERDAPRTRPIESLALDDDKPGSPTRLDTASGAVPNRVSPTPNRRTRPQSSNLAQASEPEQAPVQASAKLAPAPVSQQPSVREIALLQRARRAKRSQPSLALELVARHQKEFATSRLAQERELIAIEALVASGAHSRASRRATRFRQNYPHSAYLPRLEMLVGPR